MNDSKMQSVVLQLQRTYKTAEEKVKKLSQYMESTERILAHSTIICSLPESINNFTKEVKDIQEKYEYINSVGSNYENTFNVKEREVIDFYETVLKQISQNK